MDSLDIAFAEARRYLASLDTRPVASRGTPNDMRSMLPSHFPEQEMPANAVMRAIAAAAEPALTANASGQFFAWVKGGRFTRRISDRHHVFGVGPKCGVGVNKPSGRRA